MHYICFDVGATKTKCCIIDEHENLLELFSIKTPNEKCNVSIPLILSNIIEVLSINYNIKKVGISTAGTVDNITGSIIEADKVLPDYAGTKISKYIKEHNNLDSCVENDVICAAIGEKKYGSTKNIDNFIMTTIGTGFGGIIVKNNLIYRHKLNDIMQIMDDEKKNPDMDYSCTGSMVKAYIKQANHKYPERIDGKYIYYKLENCDLLATKIFIHFTENVANRICEILDEEDNVKSPLIIGGGISENDMFFNIVRMRVLENFYTVKDSEPAIKRAANGNKAGLFGAYYLAKECEEFNNEVINIG